MTLLSRLCINNWSTKISFFNFYISVVKTKELSTVCRKRNNLVYRKRNNLVPSTNIGYYNYSFLFTAMAENNHSFTQEQLLKETKSTVYGESKQPYSKITKSKTLQHKLDSNACNYVLNESISVKNLPITMLDHRQQGDNKLLEPWCLKLAQSHQERIMTRMRGIAKVTFVINDTSLSLQYVAYLNKIVNAEIK